MGVCDISGSKIKQASPYAGDVTPQEAWSQLQNNPSAVLVDVRSEQEWAQGVPDLQTLQKNPHLISWRFLPSRDINAQFIDQFKAENPSPEAPVFFMCKGGGRSSEAAAEACARGYGKAYNIIGGFEADNGWKASGLPWKQK